MLNVSLNVKIRLDIKVVHMFYVELFINSAIILPPSLQAR